MDELITKVVSEPIYGSMAAELTDESHVLACIWYCFLISECHMESRAKPS